MKRHTIVAACLVFLFIAVEARSAEAPKRGGRLVFGIRNDTTTLNPFLRSSSTNFYVRGLVYEALLDFDKQGKLIPSLARSWKMSPDGKSYTFALRSGVKFHNGKELTAEDVKWSAEYALDPKNAATGRIPLINVQTVNAKDKSTVEFILKQPEMVFLNIIATIRPFPIVPKDSVPPATRNLDALPPGTGPFVFKDHKADREIVFARNNDYWQKGLPYLDEVVLKPVREEMVRFTSLRAGDLDMIERTSYSFVRNVVKGEYPDLKFTEAKYAGFRRVLFNVVDSPFKDIRLRQAVLYALDKKKYIDGAFWGFGEPTDQRFPKESRWFLKLPQVKRDPEKVKALLKEAGVGPDFEVEIMGLKTEEEELQVVHELLTSAGIKTRVAVLERGARESRESRGDFMMHLSGSEVPNDPAEEYPLELGCNEEEVKAKKRIENSSGYCNKEVQRLMDEAGKITDDFKRLELYVKAIRIINEEIPEIPLAFVPRFFTYHKKVRGFETDFDGRFFANSFGLLHVWIEK
jgi:peptide/nickel transport system substrate-binding protein